MVFLLTHVNKQKRVLLNLVQSRSPLLMYCSSMLGVKISKSGLFNSVILLILFPQYIYIFLFTVY